MTVTFDGNDIYTTFGLRVSSVDGMEDREPFKNILPYWSASAELSVKEEKTITVHLFGHFDTTGELVSAVTDLDSALYVGPRHTIIFTELDYSLSVVAKDGFRSKYYGDYRTVEIDLPLTIYTT